VVRPTKASAAVALVLFVLLGVVASVPASAKPGAHKKLNTLTMDERPTTQANGLTIEGVTFGYTVNGVNSSDATFAGAGPGSTTFVQDPSLEGGTAGVLTVDFAHPTNVVRFGVALSTFDDLTPGVTVRLFNPGGRLRQTVPLATRSSSSFTEASFSYSHGAVGRIELAFNRAADRFAFDNLTFRR
jgi:hypothetical protein